MSDFKLAVLVILLSLGFSGNLSSADDTPSYVWFRPHLTPTKNKQFLDEWKNVKLTHKRDKDVVGDLNMLRLYRKRTDSVEVPFIKKWKMTRGGTNNIRLYKRTNQELPDIYAA